MADIADLILRNGKITTMDPAQPEVEAVAIKDDKFLAVGTTADVLKHAGPSTKQVDLLGRRVIPGLFDSHAHMIRGGLNYAMELRWDGIPTLADGMRMLKEQAERTPPGQWVRVVGGWSFSQFHEKRLPTLEEINAIAPETPVFVLHLYDRGLVNRAGLKALGYDENVPDWFPAGRVETDARGKATGALIAEPNAYVLYYSLNEAPKLASEEQIVSSRHYMKAVSYTHLRAHETVLDLVCRLLLAKKK